MNKGQRLVQITILIRPDGQAGPGGKRIRKSVILDNSLTTTCACVILFITTVIFGVCSLVEWIFLIYKIPSEPSRYRASIWRKIKAAGAIYLQSSVCVLPLNRKTEKSLRVLRHEIESYGGEAYLIKGGFLLQEQTVIDMFNKARNEEYDEVIDRCQDFFKEIDKEIARKHFTFGELEENEEDFEKLKKWFEKIRDRDFFQAGQAQLALEMLEKCQERIDEFGQYVFAHEEIVDEQVENTEG
ncbi:MAG: Chromate resistance protein ChrB [Bacillota bacterium]